MDYFLTNNVVGADYQLTPFSFGLAHLINTIESHNGKLYADLDHGQGSVTLWFSRTDFGGTNYSNTPIGGVSYTDESGAYATLDEAYFGLWAAGKNFAVCSWASRNTTHFQAIGDPLITR